MHTVLSGRAFPKWQSFYQTPSYIYSFPPPPPLHLDGSNRLGLVTAFFCNVTAVCANSRPLTDAPVFMLINVLHSMIPSNCDVVPRTALPAICQKMFWASAPPLRRTATPFSSMRFPDIWKIQTLFASPEMVRSVGMITLVPHL